VLPVLTGKQALAWDALMAVAADLGEGWTLIGGQMVLLHQAERRPAGADPASGASLRWSYDLDVVVNLRTNRTRMSHIDSVLCDHGFDQQILPIGHRYVDAAGTVFDVLAPDHLGRHLPRLGRGNTLQAAGGTQALKRSGRVEVERNQQRSLIPRPGIVGAVGDATVDNDGEHIWAILRCDAGPERFGWECLESDLDSVIKFAPDGTAVESFGGGMFIWPHGIDVDPDGNVWVTDAVSEARTPEGGDRGHGCGSSA